VESAYRHSEQMKKKLLRMRCISSAANPGVAKYTLHRPKGPLNQIHLKLRLQVAPSHSESVRKAALSRRGFCDGSFCSTRLFCARSTMVVQAGYRMTSFIPIFAMLLGWAPTAFAAAPAPLTTLRAIHELTKTEANQALPVAFEATVTYFNSNFRYLFVQDDGQAIFVFAPVDTTLAPGDRILVRGVTHAEFRPDVVSDSITLLRHGILPKALPVSFDQLMSGKLDCLFVTIRGQVRAANLVLRPDVRSSITFKVHVAYLEVLTDGGYVDVIVNSTDENVLKSLLDAEVEVTGATGGKYDGKWHQIGVVVRTNGFSEVKILKRASASPWSLPITPMGEVLTGYHVHNLTRRVRVRGTITYYQPGYYRPGSAIVLQNGAQSLWVESLTDRPLRIGDLVDATGIPDVASGSPTLTHAEVKDSMVQAPIAPLNVTGQQLSDANMAGLHHYDLVSIEGQVVMEAREASQDEYVLLHDGQLFSAIFHHPDSTSELPVPAMRQIPLGSRIRVTGICMLQDTTLFSGNAPFNILLRSFDDITVVAKPSWLNIRNLMLIVSLLLLTVVAVSAWGWTLERKVRRQSNAMTARVEEEAALERRRSQILEDINRSRPLAEILEKIAEMVSFRLNGAPCWCKLADGPRLGTTLPEAVRQHTVSEEIPARSGAPLGTLFAAIGPDAKPCDDEIDALKMGSRLASLAIETRRLYSDLVHRSEFDLLTDIQNRFSLDKHLDALIDKARQEAGIFGLIYIDLDEFKKINDDCGHLVGDIYLQEVALRMTRQLRPGDMLARLGGDEFAVLVPVIRCRADVAEIALRLERCFDEPFAIEGSILHGSASIGLALYPEDGKTKDSLLSTADTAMYKAKNSRRNTV
jgi:diguanylate cyclase (GGDEF)-like protein